MSKIALFLFVVLVVLGILFTPVAAKLLEGNDPQHILTTVGNAHAMGNNRSNGCHTYNVNGIFGGVENTEATPCEITQAETISRNGKPVTVTVDSTPIEEVTPSQDTQENNSQVITVTPPTNNPPTESPVVNPPSNDDKCNAGRGNGSEGNPDCDPGNSGDHNKGGD